MEFINDFTWSEIVIIFLLGTIAITLYLISGWCADMYRKLDELLKLRDIEEQLKTLNNHVERIKYITDDINTKDHIEGLEDISTIGDDR